MRFLKNFFYKPPSGIALLAGFLLFLPAHAEASMVFCNRTQNPIEAAVGYRAAIDWVSEGWWRIEPDQCSRVIGQALTQRFTSIMRSHLVSLEKIRVILSGVANINFVLMLKLSNLRAMVIANLKALSPKASMKLI
ncbi:MAG: DUF1036 domain-containing protein [Alphaproteobacteria bacterium]